MINGKADGWTEIRLIGHNNPGGDWMATPQEIQECIDSSTQIAHSLRSTANTLLCAMERQTATLGAAHLEMGINSLVQAKTLLK